MKINYHPLFICDHRRPCSTSEGCVKNGGDCGRTTSEVFAKNYEATEIYKKFFETFDPIYDDMGRITGYVEKGE